MNGEDSKVVKHPTCARVPKDLCDTEGVAHLPLTGICSGIYFLCVQNEVVYVGQSTTVVSRIAGHLAMGKQHRDYKEFDPTRIFFVPCQPDKLNETEMYWIQTLMPRYNKRGKPKDKCAEPPPLRAA
jgi:excinuclease UvrABC nuclease subunit